MIPNYIQDWIDIIENMNNDNTYKLAWGRAIVEHIKNIGDFNKVIATFSHERITKSG